MKLKGAELLLLLLVLSRRRRPTAQGGDGGTGTWQAPPGPDGLNIPVIPLPPNPLEVD